MGNVGIPQLVIIVVVVVLLFGRGKISGLMSDVAQGIKSFKKALLMMMSQLKLLIK
jgi:sec-independent protein translocase protein TatA